MSRLVVSETDAGDRLDRVVAKLLEVPRAQIQRWAGEGRVTLNGKAARPSAKVQAGDVILAEAPDPVESTVLPEAIPLVVLHEDESLIVVDKPAGLVVHPAPGHPSGTLVNALLHHCDDLAGIGGVLRPGIVHRLDRGTSGVMVVAKSGEAHGALSAQFKEHSILRLYRAWVRGCPGRGWPHRSTRRPAPAGSQAHECGDPSRPRGTHELERRAALSGERRGAGGPSGPRRAGRTRFGFISRLRAFLC